MPLDRRRLLLLLLLIVPILLVTGWRALAARPEIDSTAATRIVHADWQEVGRAWPAPLAEADRWQPGSLPDNWESRRPGYDGHVWYRLNGLPSLVDLPRPSLYLPSVSMNAELFVNGQRIGSRGHMRDPPTRHFYTPLLFDLPAGLLDEEGARDEILLLVSGPSSYRSGLAPPWVGPYEVLYDAWRVRVVLQNSLSLVTVVLSLAMGLYCLVIGLSSREYGYYAWLGAALSLWGLRNLNYVVTDPPIDDITWIRFTALGAIVFQGLFAIFALRFTQAEKAGLREARWLLPLVQAYLLCAILFFAIVPDYDRGKLAFLMIGLVGIAITVWSTWRLIRLAWLKPEPGLIAVAFGASLFIALLLNDFMIVADKHSLGDIYVFHFASLPLFGALTVTLARRYVTALASARDLSGSLQTRLDAQRLQLQASFERLREVERERELAGERTRLMGELHDGLGLHLITALHQVRMPDVPRDAVDSTLQDCLDDLRIAIDSLDAQDRDPIALLGSLRYRLAPRFRSVGIELDWQLEGPLDDLPDLEASDALDLLRIVQESLGNALKHSGARRVVIRLSRAQATDPLEVRVCDDGVGLPETPAGSGKGLRQMKARAERLGARLSIASDRGCTVALTLPLPRLSGA